MEETSKQVIPAKAGIQSFPCKQESISFWFPAFAGTEPGFPSEFTPYLIRGGNDGRGLFQKAKVLPISYLSCYEKRSFGL